MSIDAFFLPYYCCLRYPCVKGQCIPPLKKQDMQDRKRQDGQDKEPTKTLDLILFTNLKITG